MEISKEQKEAIEYLEKYTKWETYGERNLEKDIITVLELLKETQIKNEKLKNKLLDTLEGQKVIKEETPQYIEENYISKEKIENKLKIRKEELGESKDSIEASLILREIYVLEELLESEK